MSISLFDTRSMMNIVKYTYPLITPFTKLFFSKEKVSNTEYIDIPFVRGTRKLAPYVGASMQAKTINKRGYEVKTVQPPYIKIKDVTTVQDILSAPAGRNIYQGNDSPKVRARKEMAIQLKDFMDMVARKIEYEAHRVLTTYGAVTFTGEGLSLSIDFNMKATHKITLTGTALWSDLTNADPSANLKTWADLIKKDSGMAPDTVILDTDATSLYVNHPKVKANLETRRIDLGVIKPGEFGNGLQYIGYDRLAGVEIWSYSEYYESDAGVVTPIMTTRTVVMGSTKAQTILHYGAIKDLKVGTASVKYFAKSWEEEDPSVRLMSLQSAPLPAPHQIDAFVSATV